MKAQERSHDESRANCRVGKVCDAAERFWCKVPVIRTLYYIRTCPVDRTLY